MIQVYRPENTDFARNGDMTLTPSSAVLTAAMNDIWTVQLEHPIDDAGRWKYVVNGAVVKLPSFNGEQLFRVKETEKSDAGITAVLEPIFMDALDDCFLLDVTITGKNGQEALDLMTAANPKYKAKSNIMTVTDSSYHYQNLIEAINGDGEESFVNRWGGEILFDNDTISVNYRVGQDNGVELRYGKNIPQDGVTESVDTRDVVTRIYPLAYNGYAMGGNGCVDSPVIDSYPTVRTRTMTFNDVKMRADAQDSDAENGTTICDTQEQLDAALKERCDAQYSAGLDKPTVTITADMVLLENTNQYRDYAALERVSLGDTVHCIHSRLGITTQERVIELTYDCIGQKVTGVVLGQKSTNYFDKVSGTISRVDSAIRSDGTVIADQVTGRLNAALAQLVGQYNIAEKQDVMAILFENLDETSEMFGALAIGTQGILISKQRTADGKDWVWTTAISYAGIMADVIVSGRMQTKDGRFYIDLDKGESTATTLIGTGKFMETYPEHTIEMVVGEENILGGFPRQGVIVKLDGIPAAVIGVPHDFLPVAFHLISKKGNDFSIYSYDDYAQISSPGKYIQITDSLEVVNDLKVGGHIIDKLTIDGPVVVNGDLEIFGEIKQHVEGSSFRQTYGLINESLRNIIGEDQTDENGQARVDIDPLFAETVNTSCPYQVFIQPYCEGDFYVAGRTDEYFIVRGTPNGAFGYEIKQ